MQQCANDAYVAVACDPAIRFFVPRCSARRRREDGWADAGVRQISRLDVPWCWECSYRRRVDYRASMRLALCQRLKEEPKFLTRIVGHRMLMPKKNRVAIYEYLFKEGVMVAKKDYHAPKHPELESIPNLQVIKAMQSLKSRGYVKEQFAWRHFYWYLTNDGIEYLRGYLHLPPEIVPSTLKRQPRPETARPRPAAAKSESSRPTEDRAGYRRGPGGPPAPGDKKADIGPGTGDLEFRGGFGRGKAPQ